MGAHPESFFVVTDVSKRSDCQVGVVDSGLSVWKLFA